MSGAVAHVDLDAIRHNVGVLREAVAPAQVMVVVKADGYGHGAVPVARAAVEAGADWLGVVDVDEALHLRRNGITAPLLSWLHRPDEDFRIAIGARVDLGASYCTQLERIASHGYAMVQLKVDTGLSRNGADETEWLRLVELAARLEREGRIRVRALFSHLANAGAEEDARQVEGFERAVLAALDAGLQPEFTHLAATAAALSTPATRFGLVRLGIGVYGVSPFDDRTPADLGLRPAMRLSAPIASVKRVPAGAGVSYGYTYRTEGERTLALVPLGYADGVPRHASNAGPVAINGRRYRVAGRIAMDQFVVDVGDDEVRVGDEAVLFGDPASGVPSARDWAEAADTIDYEIVTRVGPRVRREYGG